MRRLFLLAAALALAAPSDLRWQIIGPGGGGTLFHPTISPHDARTIVVACDMTGNYITHDGGVTWRIFNLRDPVEFFVFDPHDPDVLYAKAGMLYRSSDQAVMWKPVFPPAASIEAVTTGDDHASEKYHLRAGPNGEVTAMAIDPDDTRSLYLGIGNELWCSLDRGATWSISATLAGQLSAIWVDPRSLRGDRTLYAAGPDAIYIRRGGKWRAGASPGRLSHVAGAPPVFYAIGNGKLFVTEDGMTWRASEDGNNGATRTSIATSLHNPDVAYSGFEGKTIGIAKTTDRGRHWETLPYTTRDAWLSERFGGGWAGAPVGIGVANDDAGTAYATDSGRVMRTLDGGRSWLPVYSRRTPDGNWTTNGMDVTTNYGVHFDPFDPRHMFITFTDISLWASNNAGESWYSATRNGVPRAWSNTAYWMEFDPTTKGRMWAVVSGVHDLPRAKMWRAGSPEGYNGGVVRSEDGGVTWRVLTGTLDSGMPQTAATHILRDPSGVLYVTGFGRGVFKSTDLGEHWVLKNRGIEGDQPFAWRTARDGKGALYLIVARRSDDGKFGNPGDGALYRSADAAEHWSRLRLPEGVNGPNGIAIDPRDPNRLYLAAWGRSQPDKGAEGGGVWLSTNAGAAWRNVLSKDQHIYDVSIDPRDSDVLYAAGFEGILWRSADRGLTWQPVPGFDFKWAHRVMFDPLDAGKLYVTTFGGSVWVSARRPA